MRSNLSKPARTSSTYVRVYACVLCVSKCVGIHIWLKSMLNKSVFDQIWSVLQYVWCIDYKQVLRSRSGHFVSLDRFCLLRQYSLILTCVVCIETEEEQLHSLRTRGDWELAPKKNKWNQCTHVYRETRSELDILIATVGPEIAYVKKRQSTYGLSGCLEISQTQLKARQSRQIQMCLASFKPNPGTT